MGYRVTICVDDIVGISEIAEHAGVKAAAVINWTQRYDDFPKPIKSLKCGRLYNRQEVQTWLIRHNKVYK